jgi:hypothetical protein
MRADTNDFTYRAPVLAHASNMVEVIANAMPVPAHFPADMSRDGENRRAKIAIECALAGWVSLVHGIIVGVHVLVEPRHILGLID